MLSFSDEVSTADRVRRFKLTTYFVLKTQSRERYAEIFDPLKGKTLVAVYSDKSDDLIAVREGMRIKYKGDKQNMTQVKLFVMQHLYKFAPVVTAGNFEELSSTFPLLIFYMEKE